MSRPVAALCGLNDVPNSRSDKYGKLPPLGPPEKVSAIYELQKLPQVEIVRMRSSLSGNCYTIRGHDRRSSTRVGCRLNANDVEVYTDSFELKLAQVLDD